MSRKRKERRRERPLSKGAVVAKYVVLTLAGVSAFFVLSAYATRQRGYVAVGGELLVLFLPVLYYVGEKTVCDLLETITGIWWEGWR